VSPIDDKKLNENFLLNWTVFIKIQTPITHASHLVSHKFNIHRPTFLYWMTPCSSMIKSDMPQFRKYFSPLIQSDFPRHDIFQILYSSHKAHKINSTFQLIFVNPLIP